MSDSGIWWIDLMKIHAWKDDDSHKHNHNWMKSISRSLIVCMIPNWPGLFNACYICCKFDMVMIIQYCLYHTLLRTYPGFYLVQLRELTRKSQITTFFQQNVANWVSNLVSLLIVFKFQTSTSNSSTLSKHFLYNPYFTGKHI